jgi:phage I-like protein
MSRKIKKNSFADRYGVFAKAFCWGNRIAIANEAPQAPGNEIRGIGGEADLIPCANETPIDKDGWLRISPYGSFPCGKGVQKFDRLAATGMVDSFNSLVSKAARLVRGRPGIPAYVGHPDCPELAGKPGHTDTRAHGWFQSIEARDDGLYGLPRWANTGDEILKNSHYRYLSPYWLMKPIGEGYLRPMYLLSVGLTNKPNIPGDAIANEASANFETIEPTTDTMNKILENLLRRLGFANEQIPGLLDPNNTTAAAAIETQITALTAAANEREALKTKVSELEGLVAAANEAKAAALTAAANERTAIAGAVIDQAISAGRITLADREPWAAKFKTGDATGFVAVANEISTLPIKVKTEPKTTGVGERRAPQGRPGMQMAH